MPNLISSIIPVFFLSLYLQPRMSVIGFAGFLLVMLVKNCNANETGVVTI